MALPVVIPNTFASATASIPLSQLDTNFTTLANAVNGISSGSETLANVTATVVNATTVDTTNIEVTNIKAKDGTAAGSIADSTGVVTLTSSVLTTTDINGGTIDGTAIGGSTAAAGSFTTLNTSGAVVFNDAGADVDFRVEGDTDANLLFVDASADKVGVGTTTTNTKFVVGATTQTGAEISAYTTSTSGGSSSSFSFWRNYTLGSTSPFRAAYISNINSDDSFNASNSQSLGFFTKSGTAEPAQRMGIANDGIVTMNAYGAGAATFSAAGVISSVSDETWKIKDGVPIDPDAMLQMLEPGYWYYNEEKAPTFGADRQLGFYAQNVNAAIGPEAAPTPEEGKPWGYYDRSVLAVAVMSLKNALNSIQELKAELDTVKAELATLKG